MPRNQGTSRKGKPKKHERAAGMGRALQKASQQQRRGGGAGNRKASTGGMAMTPGVQSINIAPVQDNKGSVLEMNDLDDFLLQAEMANREFASEKERLVILDSTAQASVPLSSIAERQGRSVRFSAEVEHGDASTPAVGNKATDFAFRELSVPRRPKWDASTTPAELDAREKEVFLDWRRAIAHKEEQVAMSVASGSGNSSIGVTPFEKNLEMWRQLWRVMERCSCIVQIVDARNPLFYLSDDLYDYATRELGKPMVLLVNKSDYLTTAQRREWYQYFQNAADDETSDEKRWNPIFFSAHEEQKELDAQAAREHAAEQEKMFASNVLEDDSDVGSSSESDEENSHDQTGVESAKGTPDLEESSDVAPGKLSSGNAGVEKPLTRKQLLDWLEDFAKKHECASDKQYERVPFGMVGFPNVGKSSVINVLMGNASNAHGVVRVGVAAQPGKTKHFQTLLIPGREDMLLCDCPGLVFPSFVNNTADLIAAGVYPIAQMRDPWPVVNLLCRRIPREILNAHYGITIPPPSADAMLAAKESSGPAIPPPTAEEFLTTLCIARGFLAASSGVPDHPRAARMVIRDYAVGQLLYCHPPPKADPEVYYHETFITSLRNTKKLRDKLLKSDPVPNTGASENDPSKPDEESSHSDEEHDDMMLELMMGDASLADSAASKSKGSKPPRKKKWGKKGRKIRNKDPYNCHTTPDEQLLDGATTGLGVVVKAGKYSQTGYTRASGYGGARGVR